MVTKIDVAACERLITAATSHCVAPEKLPDPVTTTIVHEPSWEAVSTSLTALSTAFTYGALLLAVITIALAAGWGYLVRIWAKEEAQRVARETMDAWLLNEAPRILRDGKDLLKMESAAPGTPAPVDTRDAIGENAG